MIAKPYHVGLTRECFGPDGKLVFDPIALEPLRAAPGVTFEFMDKATPSVTPEQAAQYDAIICRGPLVDRASLSGMDRRVRLIARFGAGVDKTDIDACTEAGVIVTNTPDAVRRPVASVILLLILALSHKLLAKDRITRTGRWAERMNFMGEGLTGKTVGSLGLGNIAQEMFRILRPFDMRFIGYSRNPDRSRMHALGVELTDKEAVFSRADFVCINTPLTAETRRMIGDRELGLMKPSAYFINTARGAVVDEQALYRALKDRRIAGAALDVFEQEPTPPDNPILTLDNVIVTPHSLCITDESYRNIAQSAIGSALELARGEIPVHVVNRSVLDHPELRAFIDSRRGA
jgi:D-3-phosphoglycerate dehydrogenase